MSASDPILTARQREQALRRPRGGREPELFGPSRLLHRADRAEWRRQDHRLQSDHRASIRSTPGGSCSTASTSPTCRRRRRIHHGVARNFQNIRLMPHLSALENVLVGQHCHNRGLFGVLQPVNLVPGNRWREEARAATRQTPDLAAYERADGRQPALWRAEAYRAGARADGEAAALCCSTNRRQVSTRPRPTRCASASPSICRRPRHHPAGGRARYAFRRRVVRAGDRAQFRPQDRRRHAASRCAKMRLVREAYLGTDAAEQRHAS